MFIENIIKQDYKQWQGGDTVIINSGTATGKSSFIKKQLLPHAHAEEHEILFIISRSSLEHQFVHELCQIFELDFSKIRGLKYFEFYGITVTTYQYLQERLKRGEDPNFFYIVADEIHYLFSDSAFNPDTFFFFEWIMKKTNSVLIYMSATIKNVLPYLGFYNAKWIPIDDDNDYRNLFVRNSLDIIKNLKKIPDFLYYYKLEARKPHFNLHCFEDFDELAKNINESDSNEKWLIFINNKDKIKKLQSKLKCHSLLAVAESKKEESIQRMLFTKKYEAQVLFATKFLDVGVNLIDSQITNVVIYSIEEESFLQMVGRRRPISGENKSVNLFLPKLSLQYFQCLLRQKIEPTLKFLKTDTNTLLEKMLKSSEDYLQAKKFCYCKNGTLHINPIAIDYYENRKKFCLKMSHEFKTNEFAFLQEQLRWLDMEHRFDEVIFLSNTYKDIYKKELLLFLQMCAQKELDAEQQALFRSKMHFFILKLTPNLLSHPNKIPGKTIINKALALFDLPYCITSKKSHKKGIDTTWTLIKKEV